MGAGLAPLAAKGTEGRGLTGAANEAVQQPEAAAQTTNMTSRTAGLKFGFKINPACIRPLNINNLGASQALSSGTVLSKHIQIQLMHQAGLSLALINEI